MEYEYKSVTFEMAFSTKGAFNEKLQYLLDDYSRQGWRLHTMQVCGASASICCCVFERKIED